MVKKIATSPSFFGKHHNLQEEWDYIEDPTYSRSIGSHVCMTCSKFAYSSRASCGSILCCNWHRKLICQGQHLTHSCDLYQKKVSFGFNQKNNQKSQTS